MKIHIIQQVDWVEPGEYLSWAKRRRYGVTFTKCWQYDPLPDDAAADFLVVLGGPQCPATTTADCDYFNAARERELIRKYAYDGKMVVGVCLGAQLIGEALGAKYLRSPEREIGPVPIRLTDEGRRDPFLKHFPEEFLGGEWHNDMPGLTEDAAVLAESDGCPRQIVRYGKYLYGFQTHMEFNKRIIEQGIKYDSGNLAAGGKYIQTEEELLSFDYSEMNALLAGFLDNMTESYLGQKRGG